jgi:hypothetical protein
MARKTETRKRSNGKAKANGNGKVVAAKPRINYKALYEASQKQLAALQTQIQDINTMLDAIGCPQNCGTINGRMVEYARKNYKKYSPMSNPGGEARKMLAAVEAPVVGDGPPWSLFRS